MKRVTALERYQAIKSLKLRFKVQIYLGKTELTLESKVRDEEHKRMVMKVVDEMDQMTEQELEDFSHVVLEHEKSVVHPTFSVIPDSICFTRDRENKVTYVRWLGFMKKRCFYPRAIPDEELE